MKKRAGRPASRVHPLLPRLSLTPWITELAGEKSSRSNNAVAFLFFFFPKITGQIMRLIRNARRSQRGGKRSGGGRRSDTLRAVRRRQETRAVSERRARRGAEERETSQEAQQMLTSALGGLAVAERPLHINMCLHTPAHGGRKLAVSAEVGALRWLFTCRWLCGNGSPRCVKVCYKIIHEGRNIYIYLAVVDLSVTHLAGDVLLVSPEHLCLRGHVCDSLTYVFFSWSYV